MFSFVFTFIKIISFTRFMPQMKQWAHPDSQVCVCFWFGLCPHRRTNRFKHQDYWMFKWTNKTDNLELTFFERTVFMFLPASNEPQPPTKDSALETWLDCEGTRGGGTSHWQWPRCKHIDETLANCTPRDRKSLWQMESADVVTRW